MYVSVIYYITEKLKINEVKKNQLNLPERTLVRQVFRPMSGKVVISGHRLPADVTHQRAAVAARYFVAPVLKKKKYLFWFICLLSVYLNDLS
jgi:hypothetical protein